MKKIFFMTLFLLVAASAFAADTLPAAPTTADFVVAMLNQIVFPLVTAAVGTVGLIVLSLVKKKLGLTLAASTESMLMEKAQQAVHYAEEWGAARIKQSIPTTGADKYGAALDKLRQFMPTISQEQAENYVQTAVGMIKGIGASAEVGK